MFYISDVNGNRIPYDPIEFRSRRDFDRLHPRSVQAAHDDAVIIERSGLGSTTSASTYAADGRLSEQEPASADVPIETYAEISDDQASQHEIASTDDDSNLSESEDDFGEDKPKLRAEHVMSTAVSTLTPQSSLNEAQNLFHEQRFRYVPVVSATNEVVGILSDRDFLRALAQELDTEEENISEKKS